MQKNRHSRRWSISNIVGTIALTILAVHVLAPQVVSAQEVSSTLPLQGYAYGENMGFISFSGTTGDGQEYGVRVDNTYGQFEGEAFSDVLGWISMRGETEDGESYGAEVSSLVDGKYVLTGYAWGEAIGWMSMGGTASSGEEYYGYIDADTGLLSGSVWSEGFGFITLSDTSQHYGACISEGVCPENNVSSTTSADGGQAVAGPGTTGSGFGGFPGVGEGSHHAPVILGRTPVHSTITNFTDTQEVCVTVTDDTDDTNQYVSATFVFDGSLGQESRVEGPVVLTSQDSEQEICTDIMGLEDTLYTWTVEVCNSLGECINGGEYGLFIDNNEPSVTIESHQTQQYISIKMPEVLSGFVEDRLGVGASGVEANTVQLHIQNITEGDDQEGYFWNGEDWVEGEGSEEDNVQENALITTHNESILSEAVAWEYMQLPEWEVGLEYEVSATATDRATNLSAESMEDAVSVQFGICESATYYRDQDGDGYIDPHTRVTVCDQGPSYEEGGVEYIQVEGGQYTLEQIDCDDSDSDINPDQEEICGDSKDNNCSYVVDEMCSGTCETEGLRCGFADMGSCQMGVSACVSGQFAEECGEASYPTFEVCDGQDNDCNGEVDEYDVCVCKVDDDCSSQRPVCGIDNICQELELDVPKAAIRKVRAARVAKSSTHSAAQATSGAYEQRVFKGGKERIVITSANSKTSSETQTKLCTIRINENKEKTKLTGITIDDAEVSLAWSAEEKAPYKMYLQTKSGKKLIDEGQYALGEKVISVDISPYFIYDYRGMMDGWGEALKDNDLAYDIDKNGTVDIADYSDFYSALQDDLGEMELRLELDAWCHATKVWKIKSSTSLPEVGAEPAGYAISEPITVNLSGTDEIMYKYGGDDSTPFRSYKHGDGVRVSPGQTVLFYGMQDGIKTLLYESSYPDRSSVQEIQEGVVNKSSIQSDNAKQRAQDAIMKSRREHMESLEGNKGRGIFKRLSGAMGEALDLMVADIVSTLNTLNVP